MTDDLEFDGAFSDNEIRLGDAYDLIKSVPDKSVDLVITDPPYALKGLHCSGIAKNRQYAKDIISLGITESFDMSILRELVRAMKKVNAYFWCNKDQIRDYLDYFVGELGCNFEIFVWRKTNPPPFTNNHFLKDKEYCLYFWERGVDLHVKYDTGSTVFSTSVNSRDKKRYGGHPTIKPQWIVERFIENSSDRGVLCSTPSAGRARHAPPPAN